jgi:hypothetical protein
MSKARTREEIDAETIVCFRAAVTDLEKAIESDTDEAVVRAYRKAWQISEGTSLVLPSFEEYSRLEKRAKKRIAHLERRFICSVCEDRLVEDRSRYPKAAMDWITEAAHEAGGDYTDWTCDRCCAEQRDGAKDE